MAVGGASSVRARLRVANFAYRFRESLFLLPATIVLAGIVTAELAARLDERLPTDAPAVLLDMDSNAATWLLSTVAGATITTAGVVLSLTVVSLQLASSQFSPRVMRSFIRDRLSQVVIGVLVATFAHCVLTLRHVSGEPTDPAPPLALTLAVLLAVASVLLIVAHLDHLARRLQVGEVLRSIAEEGRRVVLRTDALARRQARAVDAGTLAPPPDPAPGADGLVVTAAHGGWVTRAGTGNLLRVVPPRTTLRLETRTGAYVHAGEALAVLVPPPARRPERVARDVAGALVVASARTMQDDVDFALRQLVDIGLRALSPAVNDPTTAVEVVLRVGGLLRDVLTCEVPSARVVGPDGRVVVRPWDLTAEEYVDHGLDQLRHTAADQPQVLAALVRVVRMLDAHVRAHGRTEHVPVLRRHLDLLREVVDTGEGVRPADTARLRAIADAAVDPAEHTDGPRAGQDPIAPAPGQDWIAPAPGLDPIAPAPGLDPIAPAPGQDPIAPAPGQGRTEGRR